MKLKQQNTNRQKQRGNNKTAHSQQKNAQRPAKAEHNKQKPEHKQKKENKHKANQNKSKNTAENKNNKQKGKTKFNMHIKHTNPKSKQKGVAPVKVIPLGGLNEIGKNMTLIEYKDEILIIDCGLSFPDDEMFGIDMVIPDFEYLVENQSKIKGLVITHGHEDHIGAVPYLLKELNVPIYGTRFPLGLIQNKLNEHGLKAKLHPIHAGQKFRIGSNFEVEALRITHSIVDSVCLCINTPAGRIFHTGDFKIDYTPVDGEPIDFARLAQIGSEGVMLMMADSTNATRKGFTASEKVVGQALEDIFRRSESRIIIATFSSNVHRLQKIIDLAVLCKRKVAVSGRSMVNVVALAQELGYMKIPANVLVDLNKTKNIPDKDLVIITTGSQGEPMSALSRMATSDHKAVNIKKGDMVILSSSPIPGNEKTVWNVVNKLIEKGAEVIYSDIAEVHASGHACQEELKLMHSLIRPKYFMPVHGEYRHLKEHSELAQSLGMSENNIFIMENGDELSLTKKETKVRKAVAESEGVMVDGLGVGDVGNIVLRDRRLLSEGGLIIVVAAIDKATNTVVSGPDIISRGFVYVRENEHLIDGACELATHILEDCSHKKVHDWNTMKTAVRDGLRRYIYEKTERSPVILPIFLEV